MLAYNLFVRMVCKELEEGGLELMRSFIVMDVIHTLVRILSKDERGSDSVGNLLAKYCMDEKDSN